MHHSFTVKRSGLLLALLGAVLGCAQAVAGSDITPQELVEDTSSRMLAALKSERPTISRDSGRLYDLVSTIVLPYFDFERMSQWVLGKNWRTATPDQRTRFVEQFRNLLVRTYGQALLDYADEKIVYLPFAGDVSAPTVTVRTEIEQAGSTIPISYSMYRSRDGWKVYDVAISGVSLVTNYRSSFGNIIREQGMDSLIDQLARKNSS
ncbi:MAG: ABC transporter substrate-binding protein [Pseudomonadota bacterium]